MGDCMKAIHLILAILAVWRLTEIITIDQIFEPVRRRFPIYLWTCPRCVSIWAGAASTLFYVYSPFVNWPFALSWLFMLHGQIAIVLQSRMGRRIIITLHANNQINIHNDGITNEEVPKILGHVLASHRPADANFPKGVTKHA